MASRKRKYPVLVRIIGNKFYEIDAVSESDAWHRVVEQLEGKFVQLDLFFSEIIPVFLPDESSG